jgi:hypothetical protein
MTKVISYVQGLEINQPNNLGELAIDITYDDNGSSESLSINNWEFGVNDRRNGNDAVQLIKNYYLNGLTGGTGVLEGLPFALDLDNENGSVYNLLNGYLDVSKGKIYEDKVVAPAVELGKLDWLNTVSDSVDYQYLFEIGAFDSSDYVVVPYVISKRVNSVELAVTTLSIFVFVHALTDEMKSFNKVAGGDGGGIFTIIAFVIKIVIELIYVIFLIITIVKLIKDLIDLLVQPVKYHNGMYAADSLRIGLAHFGLTLSSSILEKYPFNKMVIIPEKYNIQPDVNSPLINGILNYTSNELDGYYKGTVGELIRKLKNFFDAKILIDGDVLYFEKQDFNITAANYKLPNLVDSGFTFNENELKSNILLTFETDANDRNTISDYTGTSVQVVHYANSVNNKKMNLLKDAERISLGFSLGKRKTELNRIENLLSDAEEPIKKIQQFIFDIVNGVINAVKTIVETINKIIKVINAVGGKITLVSAPSLSFNLAGKKIDLFAQEYHVKNRVSDRIDMLMMESDYIDVPKVVLIDNQSDVRQNKLLPDNESVLNANYIYDNYHYFRNFVTTSGWNNQFVKKSFESIPFVFTDYEKVRRNNRIFTSDGEEAILTSLKYNPIAEKASGTYKVRQVWTNNLSIKKIIPNG